MSLPSPSTSALVLAAILQPSPAPQSATWIVDASGTVAGAHAAGIDDLIGLLPVTSGDTILVKGLVKNGLLYGYTDAPTGAFPGQGVETWPIDLPEGVTLQPYDATPVLLHESQSTAAPLVKISGPSSTNQTVVHGLYLASGPVAISADHSGTHHRSVRVSDCTFVQTAVAVSAVASGTGRITADVVDCELRPSHGLISHLAIPHRDHRFGLRFRAESQAGAPRVDAAVSGLRVVAGFTTSATTSSGSRPWAYQGPTPVDLGSLTSSREPTRVIDIYATGVHREHQAGGVVPIPEVVVDVSGCTLDGSAGGWDLGVYAAGEARPGTSGGGDYFAGYQVAVTGTTIQDFGLAGVYATIGDSARGVATIGGNSTVSGTGTGNTHRPASAAYSGIHGFSYLGMLAVACKDSTSNDNTGHGVYLRSAETRQTPDMYPVGLHFEASDSGFHGNEGCGIAMSIGHDYVGGVTAYNSGIVGGTWRETSTGSAQLTLTGGTDHSVLPSGQGSINRCAISNNGEFGIFAFAGAPQIRLAFVDCRITNSIIWNNPYGGVFGQSGTATGQQQPSQIHMILPVIHCTLVGNGRSGLANPFTGGSTGVDFSIEYYENQLPSSGGFQDTAFEWSDPLPGGDRATVLFNCIFDRLGTGLGDLGPILDGYVRVYPLPFVVPAAPGMVHAAGCRGVRNSGTSPFGTGGIVAPPNYSGGSPSLNSHDPVQFFLADAGPANAFSGTPGFTQFGAVETIVDFSLTARDPVIPGAFPDLPEMGADEL